jgi:flagella basal body P-ring formation protein FlgA
VRFADGRVRWFMVSGFAPILLSTHAIEAGAPLNAEDTFAAERDVIALGCEPLMNIDSGARMRATRRLAIGDAICANTVAPAPEIQRDRPVLLSTQRGPVSASRVLTATADAKAGERVRLRDPASGDTVIAIVTGPGFARDPNSQEQK